MTIELEDIQFEEFIHSEKHEDVSARYFLNLEEELTHSDKHKDLIAHYFFDYDGERQEALAAVRLEANSDIGVLKAQLHESIIKAVSQFNGKYTIDRNSPAIPYLLEKYSL